MLIDGCRLLLIHGITGVGKTTLAEKLAADLLGNDGAGRGDRLSLPPDIKFHRISFDIGTPSTDFTRGALAILQAIADDTAQQLPDEQILPYLLKTLEQHPYWLQFNSLEYLLHQASDGAYHFADAVWVEFFVPLLNSPANSLTSAKPPPPCTKAKNSAPVSGRAKPFNNCPTCPAKRFSAAPSSVAQSPHRFICKC